MRRKISILLIAGLLFTAAASAGTYFYLRAMEADLQAAREKLEQFSGVVSVPILLRDISRGEPVTEGDVTSEQISTGHLPDDLIRTLEDVSADGDKPLIARDDLKAGQFLLRAHLAIPGEIGSAGVMLPVGARAHALRPANSDGLAARLGPGDAVDVFWRNKAAGQGGETRLLATRLQVARPDPRAGEAPPAEAEQGAGTDTGPVESEKLVLVGPPEEIALLIQTDGRGEHLVVPANNASGPEGERAAVDDRTVSARPAASAPAARSAVSSGRVSGEGRAGNSAGADEPSAAPEDAVAAIRSLVKAPPKCTLNIIRSATRSVIEVPC